MQGYPFKANEKVFKNPGLVGWRQDMRYKGSQGEQCLSDQLCCSSEGHHVG